MQSRKYSSKRIIYLFLIAVITVVIISGTYARYTTKENGESKGYVAKWSFKVNGLDNESLTRASISDGTIIGDKIAPGTEGYFTVEIDLTGCEVAVEYKIEISNIKNKPTNLYFYEDNTYNKKINSKTETPETYEIKGRILKTDERMVEEKIYWKWEYETENGDTNDTNSGKEATSVDGETMSFDVKVTATQVLKYRIQYIGEGENLPEEHEVDEPISTQIPTRTNYRFLGWSTVANATQAEYQAGETYLGDSNATLYAVWELDTPEVTISVSNPNINLFDNVTTTFTANTGKTNQIDGYQWYYNNSPITGATSATYSIATQDMTTSNYKGGTYKVAVTNEVGTAENTATQTVTKTVETAEQMKNFSTMTNKGITFSGDTITQTANIDLSSVCGAGNNWTPIGNLTYRFAGTYNGGNYSISNLYINNSGASYQGLFGTNNGTIKSFTVTGTVIGCVSVGEIVGLNEGTVREAINEATITGYNDSVGGIVGASSGTVESCINKGNVTNNRGASAPTGGIVGWNFGPINNCYNTGNIYSTSRSGGIAGYINASSGSIKNCYNIGKISGTSLVGGVLGVKDAGTVQNCYYTIGTAAGGINSSDISGQAVGKYAVYMKSTDFVNVLGSSNWKLVSGLNGDYPVLSWQNGTAITRNVVAEYVNINSTGFEIYCYVSPTAYPTVTKCIFPTWTLKVVNETQQDEIEWPTATNLGGNVFYYKVLKSNHKNESGYYVTHIYGGPSTGTEICLYCLSAINVP